MSIVDGLSGAVADLNLGSVSGSRSVDYERMALENGDAKSVSEKSYDAERVSFHADEEGKAISVDDKHPKAYQKDLLEYQPVSPVYQALDLASSPRVIHCYELAYWRTENDKIVKQSHKLSLQHLAVTQENIRLKAEVADVKEKALMFKKEIRLEHELLRERFSGLQSSFCQERERFESEAKSWRTQKNQLKLEIAGLQLEENVVKERVTTSLHRAMEMHDSVEDIDNLCTAALTSVAVLKEKFSSALADIATLKDQLCQSDKQNVRLEGQLEGLTAFCFKLTRENKNLEKRLADKDAQIVSLKKQLDTEKAMFPVYESGEAIVTAIKDEIDQQYQGEIKRVLELSRHMEKIVEEKVDEIRALRRKACSGWKDVIIVLLGILLACAFTGVHFAVPMF